MSVVLSILGWILLGVLGLVVFVVCMPLHLEASGWFAEGEGSARAQARWGWVLVRLRADTATGVDLRILGLRVWRLGAASVATREKRAAKKARRAEKRTQRVEESGRALRRAGLGRARGAWQHRQALLRMLGAVWHAIPVRGHLYGVLGLSDPGDTAALFGAITPLAARAEHLDVDLEPDWIDDGLDVEGALSVRIWPIHIVLALLWLVVRDGPTRRGMWALVRARR